ncbi:unknown [Clostridium sp. CAG:524]|jgi:flagellar basal body rod protein FlgG|nr:unknown [Clostridium sp. CAG:524]
MIDKVIKLDNNLEYYVLDEMTYEEKNYLMGLQVDNEKEGITNNYIIVESRKDLNGNVTLVDIDNPELLEKVGNLFIERLNKQ